MCNMDYRSILRGQIREVYGKVVYTYTTHIEMLNLLLAQNRCHKNIQIVMTAISTGGFLGDLIANIPCLQWPAGIAATISLALNLYFRDQNLEELISRHRGIINDLWYLREQYLSLLTDFDVLDDDSIRARRDLLSEETQAIYKIAPNTNSKAYEKAQKNLKENEFQFFRPEEIDQMLPETLRQGRN
mgnify:FL=1